VRREYTIFGFTSATVRVNTGDNIIGCVHALDRWDDDTGGYAEIVGGGIGYNYVDVGITSQFSRGFHFDLEVYGQKPQTCKYLRNVALIFAPAHTHTHTYHTCGYTTF
jgi:hypothetical protein